VREYFLLETNETQPLGKSKGTAKAACGEEFSDVLQITITQE